MCYAVRILNKVATKNANFTADTGMCKVWTARMHDLPIKVAIFNNSTSDTGALS